MAEQEESPAPAVLVKLPVWSTVKSVYRFVWARPAFLAATLSVPLAVGIIGSIVGVPIPSRHEDSSADVSEVILFIAFYVAMGLAVVPGVVQWHQAVLLGREKSGWLEGGLYRSTLRYIGKVFLIMLILIPFVFPLGLFAMLAGAGIGGIGIGSGLALAIFLVMSAVCVRIFLCLPPAAAGIRGFSIRAAWRISKRNSIRLLVTTFLIQLPLTGVLLVVDVLPLPTTAILIATYLVNATSYFTEAVFLSLAYLHLRSNISQAEVLATVGA